MMELADENLLSRFSTTPPPFDEREIWYSPNEEKQLN